MGQEREEEEMREFSGIYDMLSDAQAEMHGTPVPKNGTMRIAGNEYRYVLLPDLLKVVVPAIFKRNGFFTQSSVRRDDGVWVIRTMVGWNGETAVLDEEPYSVYQKPQDTGTSETYARRYGCLKAFGLAGDDDADGLVEGEAARMGDPKAGLIASIESGKKLLGEPERKEIAEWYSGHFGNVGLSALTAEQLKAVDGYVRLKGGRGDVG